MDRITTTTNSPYPGTPDHCRNLRLCVALLVAGTIFFDGYAQERSVTGFYVVIKNQKNCPNLINSRTGTAYYCLPKEPIIPISDFEAVSEVLYDSILQGKFFLLRLTENGFKSIRFLTQRMPESQLALVVNNQVAGLLDHVDKDIARTIPIRGGINTTDIDWIGEQLKKEKP